MEEISYRVYFRGPNSWVVTEVLTKRGVTYDDFSQMEREVASFESIERALGYVYAYDNPSNLRYGVRVI
jgi:hypothetical protein